MKHVSRIAALILAVLVFCTGCGSSVAPDKYKTTVAATYGDQTTYLDEANFWMRLNQWGTESYAGVMYRYYYGITDIWPIASGVRTQTFEQTLKENTMAEILQTYILLEHAGDYASSALTDSDNEKIAALIADIRDGYADEFFTLAGVADGEAGDAQMKAYFEKRVQAYKVARAVMDQAQVSVQDEDCKSFRIAYILVPEEKETTTESTASTEGSTSSSDPVGEALANVIRSNLVAGKTWEETKEAWKDLTSNEVTYAYTEESSSKYCTHPLSTSATALRSASIPPLYQPYSAVRCPRKAFSSKLRSFSFKSISSHPPTAEKPFFSKNPAVLLSAPIRKFEDTPPVKIFSKPKALI